MIRIKKPEGGNGLLFANSKDPVRVDLNNILFANAGIFYLNKPSFTKPNPPAQLIKASRSRDIIKIFVTGNFTRGQLCHLLQKYVHLESKTRLRENP